MNTKKKERETINKLIRDITRVGWMSKSEAKARIKQLLIQEYRKGFNACLKEQGLTGVKHQHLYL